MGPNSLPVQLGSVLQTLEWLTYPEGKLRMVLENGWGMQMVHEQGCLPPGQVGGRTGWYTGPRHTAECERRCPQCQAPVRAVAVQAAFCALG